jgi:hypothetical protein
MGKKNILEYFEGNADRVYDTNTETTWRFDDDQAICFGYFPVSINNDYKLLVGTRGTVHRRLAERAAEILVGKAKGIICNRFESYMDWIEDQCYDKAYGLGRCWKFGTPKYPDILAFWYPPSSEMVAEVTRKLKLDPTTCIFVTEDSKSEGAENITAQQYIDEGHYENNNIGQIINEPFKLDDKIIGLIRSYNAPSDTWQAQKERKGWDTLAQRNATIYQESKEDKKENINNMKNNKKYQEEFSNYTKIMNEALQKGDFKAYEYVKDMLEEAIEDSKHEKELMEEMNTTNFGMLNHIFENELPTLIKNNKKAVRNVIKTIKEDRNLRSQFSFYNVIKEQYNSSHAEVISPEVALEKLVKIVCEEVDQKTIKKSNKKLRDVMFENNIIPSDFIDDESKKLYESGNVILTTKRTSNNMLPLAESYNVVCEWMDKHKDDKKNNDKDVDKLIEEFENKLKTNLNESEMSFVQEITDFRSPIAEKRKEKLFNKFKNECITKINEMLNEDSENAELKELNDKINEMTFNKDSIVKDIAKLLEIRDILMED